MKEEVGVGKSASFFSIENLAKRGVLSPLLPLATVLDAEQVISIGDLVDCDDYYQPF